MRAMAMNWHSFESTLSLSPTRSGIVLLVLANDNEEVYVHDW